MNSTFSYKFARAISTLFVPPSLTIIIYTIFAISLENTPLKQILTILIAFVFGFAAPIILFLILRKRNKIIDQDASRKEERTFPYILAIIFYLMGFVLMLIFKLNIISIAFWFCYISNTFLTIIINRYWKISAHSMGVSGTLSAMLYTFSSIGLIQLPIVLLVGWSRIKLGCHNLAQVVTGTVLAFVSVYFQMHLIIKYFG